MVAEVRLLDLNVALNVAMLAALVVAIVIVGRSKAKDSTINAQTAELDAREKTEDRLRDEVAGLRTELQEARAACATDIAKLEGQVQQLSAENESLRGLVMGTTVPDALRQTLIETVERGAAKNREFYEELLRPLLQGMDRLLTAGGEEAG